MPPDGVEARVKGSSSYQVTVRCDAAGVIRYDCDCPLSASFEFCKHCVAVALAWIDAAPSQVETRGGDVESERFWDRFASNPSTFSYEIARGEYERRGLGEEFRMRALLEIRRRLEVADADEKLDLHELLIEVFLEEGDTHAALIEARTGECPPSTLADIADHLLSRSPLEAGEIYLELAEQMLRTEVAADERLDVVELITSARSAYKRGRRTAIFRQKIQELRALCGMQPAVARAIDSLL